jgi:hypothetical protein
MINLDKLKQLLEYNPETGLFIWKVATAHRTLVGTIAGSVNCSGYVRLQIAGKLYQAHRLAWLYMTGSLPKEHIDHVNGIKQDNRWCNLREASNGQNQQNQKLQKNNTVGVKGLTYREASGNRAAIYIASVKCLGTSYTKAISVLKNRSDEDIIEELSTWLDEMRKTLHKEFANNGGNENDGI